VTSGWYVRGVVGDDVAAHAAGSSIDLTLESGRSGLLTDDWIGRYLHGNLLLVHDIQFRFKISRYLSFELKN
jgi:hypothetical protein